MYNQIRMAAKKEQDIGTTVEQEKSLVKWKAKTRPFKKRSREFYVNLFSVSGLVGLIIFLIEGVVPVVLIVALLFLFYVFSTIEPDEAEYEITSFGVRINGQIVKFWEEMGLYWFAKRMNEEVVVIQTNTVPWKMELVVDPKIKKDIEDVVSRKLHKNEHPETQIDKLAAWLGEKIR